MEIQQLQRQAQHRPGPSHLTLGPRGHPTPGVSKHGYANVAAAEEAAASLRSDKLTEVVQDGTVYEGQLSDASKPTICLLGLMRVGAHVG